MKKRNLIPYRTGILLLHSPRILSVQRVHSTSLLGQMTKDNFNWDFKIHSKPPYKNYLAKMYLFSSSFVSTKILHHFCRFGGSKLAFINLAFNSLDDSIKLDEFQEKVSHTELSLQDAYNQWSR